MYYNYKAAYEEWQDKTEWVQETAASDELGMHRADVLKRRIEQLEQMNKQLREQAAKDEVLGEITGCFDAAIAEGLFEAIETTSDYRLKDLLERRIMHAYFAAIGPNN